MELQHWKCGVFYAEGLKQSAWLGHFASQFETVEINNSFYRLPSEETFKKWRAEVHKGFIFAVRETLGPVLFQLPPSMKFDVDRLSTFAKSLRRHPVEKKTRAVLEVRDPSWLNPNAYETFEKYKICFCFADWREMPVEHPVTTDFVYIRRHSGQAGDGNYSHTELGKDIRQIKKWSKEGRDVYIYFNNDWKGYAIENARYIRDRI